MFNPFSRKKGQTSRLGVDVGTVAVKLLQIDPLTYSSSYLDKYSAFDSTSFTQDLVKRTLIKAFNKASLKKESFDEFNLILPPTFFKSRVVNLNFEREDQSSITERDKKRLMDQARGRIKENISAELGILKSDLYFKRWEIISAEIDGYSVSDIVGYNGTDLELKILTSFLVGKTELVEALKGFLGKETQLIHLAHCFDQLGQEEIEDGLYLDIGGELTQAFLVQDKELEMVADIKAGSTTFSQALVDDLGLSELRSKTLKERYARQDLSREVTRQVKEMFSESRAYWFKELKDKLRRYEKTTLPGNIFLFGGGSKLPDFPSVLKGGSWEDFTLLGSPQVKFFPPKSLGFELMDVQYTPLALTMKHGQENI